MGLDGGQPESSGFNPYAAENNMLNGKMSDGGGSRPSDGYTDAELMQIYQNIQSGNCDPEMMKLFEQMQK